MVRCGVEGCEKEATKLVKYVGGWIKACDEHSAILEKEMEELERTLREEKEKRERAIEEARRLLSFKLNEVPFVVKEYEDSPDVYVTLGKKVPYEVYKELVSEKALMRDGIYYVIRDEQKAAQILQKHGFKVIFSKEWQERYKRACEILRQAGVPLSSVPFI